MSKNRLRNIVSEHLSRSFETKTTDSTATHSYHRPNPKLGVGLKLLRIIPWSLLALFIFSFIWDFNYLSLLLNASGIYLYSNGSEAVSIILYSALRLPEFSRALELEGLIVTVSAAGLIGFFTNWLAITMLFHPRQPRPLLGQGIIPGSRERVAHLIAQAISKDLISEDVILERIHVSGVVPKYRDMALQVTENLILDEEFQKEIKGLISQFLAEKLSSPELKEKIVSLVMEMIDSAAKNGLAGVAVKVYRMLNRDGLYRQIEEAIDTLPETVDFAVNELTRTFQTIPEKIAERSDDIELWLTKAIMSFVSTLDIYDMVSRNLRQFDDRRFENLIKRTSSHQLIYIKYLGGALGAIGGLVIFDQWVALPLLAAIIGTVIALDKLILWIMNRRQVVKGS
ncbi:MAG: DUF445 family protein [Bacteroidetes bacterium]|nr:DUF445 family protein [Bacteroidota bacterium]